MADDFKRYDKVRKFQDFPPLPPQNPDHPGAGVNPLDDRGVKDLIEVINAFGPDFPPDKAAKYLRELSIEYPTNADVYEAAAKHEDMRALKRKLSLQAAENKQKKLDASAALKQERHRRFVEWCKTEGVTLRSSGEPDDDPADSRGRQSADDEPDDAQPIDSQGAQPIDSQGAQPQGAVHLRACEWVLSALAHGPQPESALATKAKVDHLSKASLRRAKTALGVKSVRQGNHWVWSLPPMTTVSVPMTPEADVPGEPDAPPPAPPLATNPEPLPPAVLSNLCFQCGKPMKSLDGTVSGWECINCSGSGNDTWTG